MMRSILFVTFSLLLHAITSFSIAWGQFVVDGKVIELNDTNFDEAISTFDHIFIDFYAPWCGHCMKLNPELDEAAPILAGLKNPVIVAKVDADKYTSISKKHEVDAFPTLKLFSHGVPTKYYGPRKFDQLVQYLKKYSAPDIAILNGDSGVAEFVEEAGIEFPVFIGFNVKESILSNLGSKYKEKAWFSVAEDFSEEWMSLYEFDRVPALVGLRPSDSEKSLFYGPFEEKSVEDFIKQNLLPLVVTINERTLRELKGEERKIALTIVDDETSDKSRDLIKHLKIAAAANRDLIFGFVGFKQFDEFVGPFEVSRKTRLPKMIVWGKGEEYVSVNGSEWNKENEQGSQITRFLEGYRAGNVVQNRVTGPSLINLFYSLFGIGTICMIVFILILMVLIFVFMKDDEPTTEDRRQSTEGTSNVIKSKSGSGRDKED